MLHPRLHALHREERQANEAPHELMQLGSFTVLVLRDETDRPHLTQNGLRKMVEARLDLHLDAEDGVVNRRLEVAVDDLRAQRLDRRAELLEGGENAEVVGRLLVHQEYHAVLFPNCISS